MSESLESRVASKIADCFAGEEGVRRNTFAAAMHCRLIAANESISAITSKQAHFCGRNCVHCCSQIFSVSRAEVAAITYYLINNREILSTFLVTMAERDRDYPDRRVLRTEMSSKERELEYFSKKIPCDFLAGSGDCLIYPVRPLNCSAYIAYAPARICSMEPKGHIPPEAWRTYLDQRLWFESQSCARYPGRDKQTYFWPFDILDNLQNTDF
ncbi:MAG TPA: YkgJ family cysteine cluster protein [Geobacteraceae bacterium]|nr:YkgJ family cysteine cluster protein [Geobacteraceae bacterium]